MQPICSVTKNIMEGTAHGYHLSYHHLNVNGESVPVIVAIGDNAKGLVEMTQSLQTFTVAWEELKLKLPSPESLTFRLASGTWEYSDATALAWVPGGKRSP
jgi:hypothetical protein